MTYYMLDADKNPVATDVQTWAQTYNFQNRVVAKTDINPSTNVSTVFLGIDHSFGGTTPILFETMIFGGPRDQECHRFATWAEAELFHMTLVEDMMTGAG